MVGGAVPHRKQLPPAQGSHFWRAATGFPRQKWLARPHKIRKCVIMSNDSKTALHNFLFHLRTPLASLSGVKAMVEKGVVSKDELPSEAREWVTNWATNVDRWLKSARDFTEFYFAKDNGEIHDWKVLIQQLLSLLEGVEIAARDAEKIHHSSGNRPGDVLFVLVHSINYVNDRCKEMKELLPTLE